MGVVKKVGKIGLMKCPQCASNKQQHKVGKTRAGSQRLRCYACKHTYTPKKKPRGYPVEVRRRAMRFYVDGMNLRRIARHLGIHHTTVMNWTKAHAAQLPAAPVPQQVQVAEMDELFTFIGQKKTGST